MKELICGAVGAVLLASVALAPSAKAAECPVLAGPDWSGETLSADPARLVAISDVYHARAVYEPFVAADAAMQPIPWLAESWESDSTAKEWTFQIRQGVKFHDGSPLTADDVVYTFRRLLDPAVSSPGASELGNIKPEAFQAVDAATMKVTLDSPIAELPSVLATKHGMVVKNGASSDDIGRRPNGTGPFTLKELKLGDLKTTFTKHDGYWRSGLPKSECLTVTAITEPLSRVAALDVGRGRYRPGRRACHHRDAQGRSQHHVDQGPRRLGRDHGHVHGYAALRQSEGASGDEAGDRSPGDGRHGPSWLRHSGKRQSDPADFAGRLPHRYHGDATLPRRSSCSPKPAIRTVYPSISTPPILRRAPWPWCRPISRWRRKPASRSISSTCRQASIGTRSG